MINLFIFIILSLKILVFSQSFTVTPLKGRVETKNLPKNVKVLFPEKGQRTYLSSLERDKILKKHIPEDIKDLDEVDKDILYKHLVNSEDSEITKKYPFLKNEVIKRIKNEIK